MDADTLADDFLRRWHRIVAERDLEGLYEILAEEVAIGAPPYWQELSGRPLVHHLLVNVIQTIEGFTYHREWVNGRELALEFRGRVGEHELQGIDLITLDDEGRVAHLDVPMRPLNAVAALREQIAPKMQAFLARQAGKD
jgi:hypothetical protein